MTKPAPPKYLTIIHKGSDNLRALSFWCFPRVVAGFRRSVLRVTSSRNAPFLAFSGPSPSLFSAWPAGRRRVTSCKINGLCVDVRRQPVKVILALDTRRGEPLCFQKETTLRRESGIDPVGCRSLYRVARIAGPVLGKGVANAFGRSAGHRLSATRRSSADLHHVSSPKTGIEPASVYWLSERIRRQGRFAESSGRSVVQSRH